MRLIAALGALLGSGCITDSTVRCGDLACPADMVCWQQQQCVHGSQIDACSQSVDGDPCTTSRIVRGYCEGGLCTEAICGNGTVERGEVCDDGNAEPGDGCSARCDSNEECGNGVVDYSKGEQCDDGNTSDDDACRTDCVVATCGDGVIDTQNGEACDDGPLNSNAVDVECRINCQPRRCGDAIVDTGEACDDGNLASGDGCSGDCLSTEQCGDGYVNSLTGELCDDGNTRNRDGCSATCQPEAYGWRAEIVESPRAMSDSAMAYDAARRRIVLFGGHVGAVYSSETWEHDGVRWLRRRPLVSPPARGYHAMAYDAFRGRIVMHGGRDAAGGGAFDDTWEYDGVRWSRQVLATRPPATINYAMAYDAARRVMVMWSGALVWEYDGSTWTDKQATTPPPGSRNGLAMAYHPIRNRVLMFGGNPTDTATYEYDGVGWSVLTTTGGITARRDHAMTYDPDRERIVVSGGVSGAMNVTDTWELDFSTATPTWSQRATTGPTPLSDMKYDLAAGKMLMFGGTAGAAGDTWTYVDGQVMQQPLPPSPGARSSSALAFDAGRGAAVLFGGVTNAGVVDDTWEHVGESWIARTPITIPSSTLGHAIYDPHAGHVLMIQPSSSSLAIHAYDGTTWTPMSSSADPGISLSPTFAYDIAHSRAIYYDGSSGATWTLACDQGACTWTMQTAGPNARIGQAMTYDAARARCVSFGGNTFAGILTSATWELDDTTWSLAMPITAPGVRNNSTIVFDAGRRQAVLFGGYDGSEDLADTWLYNGSTWTELVTTAMPPARQSARMTYDSVERRVILFGGLDGSGPRGDTWSLGYDALVAGEACYGGIDYDRDGAVGCADDECWAVCTPTCSPDIPSACVPTGPRCGDGVCSTLEDCHLCPADCAVGSDCPIRCGDFFCDAPETIATCPGDCTP